DDTGRCAQPLRIHEVSQRELEDVEAVDEREVDDALREPRHGVIPGKEFVAGRLHQLEVTRKLDLDAEARVHAYGAGARLGEAEAIIDPDLEVAPRPVTLVDNP